MQFELSMSAHDELALQARRRTPRWVTRCRCRDVYTGVLKAHEIRFSMDGWGER